MTKVRFAEPAEYDLVAIEHYIQAELCNPTSAERIIKGIIDVSYSLAKFPKRHSFVNDDFLARLGIRLTMFESYNIFYVYDEKNDIVYIIRVLYERQDWKNVLRP